LAVTLERDGDRVQTMTSVGTEVYYVDGIEWATGKSGDFYERCDAASPLS
jgi:hypothetical protein